MNAKGSGTLVLLDMISCAAVLGTRFRASALSVGLASLFLGITGCSTTNVTNVYGASDGAAADGGVGTDAAPDDAATDGTADEGAAPDAGPPDMMSFWPLAVGYRWEGDFSLGNPTTCGRVTYDVTATMSGDGRAGFVVSDPCTADPFLLASNPDHTVDGFDGSQGDAGSWSQYLPAGPIANGWSSFGPITVPAGTFSDCIRSGTVGSNIYFVYCRGVGPVEWTFANRGHWRLVRTSF